MMSLVDAFQSATPFLVLFAMGCAALVFSLYFYRKRRALGRLAGSLYMNVFDKSFNVYDPYPERRKVIGLTVAVPLLLVLTYFLIGYLLLKVLESGLVLGFVLFAMGFGLMMVDEALELYSNAKLFTKAATNRTDFGQGDLKALSILLDTMPKLSKYYVLLAAVFFASAVAFPYIASPTLMAFSLYVGTTIEYTSSTGIWSLVFVVLAYTLLFMTVYFVAGRLKSRIFGSSTSTPFAASDEPFERIKIVARWGEAPPYELSHRPVLEDPEVEERKRKALTSDE
jgi:hypothetical protein